MYKETPWIMLLHVRCPDHRRRGQQPPPHLLSGDVRALERQPHLQPPQHEAQGHRPRQCEGESPSQYVLSLCIKDISFYSPCFPFFQPWGWKIPCWRVPVAAEGLTTVSTRTSPVEAGGTSRPRGPARSSTPLTAGTRRTSCWAGRQWSTWAGGWDWKTFQPEGPLASLA